MNCRCCIVWAMPDRGYSKALTTEQAEAIAKGRYEVTITQLGAVQVFDCKTSRTAIAPTARLAIEKL